MLRNKKGITLIVLIITIIVLLIIAGVAISMAVKNDGILQKSQFATETYNKNTAIEKIELKIATARLKIYSTKGRNATLQEVADYFCEQDDVEYVLKQSKSTAGLQKIDVSDVQSFFTKLKNYTYEFEISDNLALTSIDGNKYTSTYSGKENDNINSTTNSIGGNDDINNNTNSGGGNDENNSQVEESANIGQQVSYKGLIFTIREVQNGTVTMSPNSIKDEKVTFSQVAKESRASFDPRYIEFCNSNCSSRYSDSTRGITAVSATKTDYDNGWIPQTNPNATSQYQYYMLATVNDISYACSGYVVDLPGLTTYNFSYMSMDAAFTTGMCLCPIVSFNESILTNYDGEKWIL